MSENVDSDDYLSNLLKLLEFSATVFFRAQYCGTWAVDTSGEQHVPFHLITQGEGWLHGAGNEPRKLMSGQLVLFPKDTPHILSASSLRPDPGMINQPPAERMEGSITRLVCGFFSFDQRASAPLLSSLPETLILNLSDATNTATRDLVQLWMSEAGSLAQGSDVAVDLFAELVFIHILRDQMNRGEVVGLIGALADQRLGPILAAIHKNPGDDHRLPSIAKQARMSESAFAQRFKKQVGMTPGHYVRHWRMHKAARAMKETSRSMGDIALSVGYESEAAFRKAFRSHIGISPGKYRKARH